MWHKMKPKKYKNANETDDKVKLLWQQNGATTIQNPFSPIHLNR